MKRLRHTYTKIGVRLFQCLRCGAIKQTTKGPSIFRVRASAPWQPEEPVCNDPNQPALYDARPDDADEYAIALPLPREPAPRVQAREANVDTDDVDRRRMAAVSAIVDRFPRPSDDGEAGAQDPVALALSIFGADTVVTYDAPKVDFGDHHVLLVMDEEKQWRIACESEEGRPLGLRLYVEATRDKAIAAAQRYMQRAKVQTGSRVTLTALDGSEERSWTRADVGWCES